MIEIFNSLPLDVLILSITTYFAIIGPIDVAVVFGAISGNLNLKERKKVALNSVIIASLILLCFCLFGSVILTNFGISLPALRVSGGILLLIVSIQMIFAQPPTAATSANKEELEEAKHKADITVFPLAIPLIAGPASMGGSILLISQYEHNWYAQSMVIFGMFIVLLMSLVFMTITTQLQKFLGLTGINVIQRIFGILLSALAVQFIFDGIKQSSILT